MAKRICVVEDDESIQDILRIIIEKAGYEFDGCADGRSIISNGHGHPDLFLLDKQLVNADGLELCQYLKKNTDTKDIPVVMMSAYPNVKDLAYAAGAEGFIEKPFNVSALLKTISDHLRKQEEIEDY